MALHTGRTLQVAFTPTTAVVVPDTPDATVLRPEGRSCDPDGTAIFKFAAVQPGTAVFVFSIGPRCLHARPPCLPAEQAVPLRIDVVT